MLLKVYHYSIITIADQHFSFLDDCVPLYRAGKPTTVYFQAVAEKVS
jgi:hypothetical protein